MGYFRIPVFKGRGCEGKNLTMFIKYTYIVSYLVSMDFEAVNEIFKVPEKKN